MRSPWPARLLSWALALVAGGVFGVAGTIAHAYRIAGLPVGFVLAAIGCASFLIALRCLTPGRSATVFAGIGMLGLLLVYSGRGPGGSVVVPADGYGLWWSYVIGGIVLLAIAWPDLSRHRRSPDGDGGGEDERPGAHAA